MTVEWENGETTDEPLGIMAVDRLPIWTTDIASAYLEAHTKEKVCIMAGLEFGTLEDHCLIVDRALYGLRTSGQRWHERFV